MVSECYAVSREVPIVVDFNATWDNSNIQTWLLLRTLSGSVVLLQLGTVLKSEALVASEGHTEARVETVTCGFLGVWETYHRQSHPGLSC